MKRLLFAVVLACAASPSLAADRARPTLVELYQSQGCSSCPPAIANVNALADRADILPLLFAVPYWDRLGWKDIFAQPAFTRRQWDYAKAAGRGQVATPQTIVNGRAVTNGGNEAALLATIRRADRGAAGPTIDSMGGRVRIGAASTAGAATIWLVRYDTRALAVPIRAGENGGLTHRNVVRSIDAMGLWRGAPITVAVPAAADRSIGTAILVQQGRGGPIVAAARL